MNDNLVQELRWDPTLGEWVMVSNIRDLRPWQPQEFCPFCPGAPETGSGWNVLILENRYPMLSIKPYLPREHRFYKSAPAYGKNYVVIETPEHNIDDLSDLPVEHIRNVLNVLKEKFNEVSKNRKFVYFFYFRNKGKEIGVSLTHPHAQIYVLPFIPVKVKREIDNALEYYKRSKECLFCRILITEEQDNIRVVYKSKEWTAFIPYYAHWPFEVHIYPRRHIQTLKDLDDDLLQDLALILKMVLRGFKTIFDKPMPYMMVLHQAPIHGNYYYYHLHFEIYGVYRTNGKLKYAASMETGGGNFTYDSIPEKAAELLRKVINKSI